MVPQLFHLQNPKSIKGLSIDFSDGKGYRPLEKNSKFQVRYESIGEKVVGIKFQMRKKTFVSYSKIKVITLDNEEPAMVLFPTSGAIKSGKSTVPNTKIGLNNISSRSASGGSASVYLGCDITFDQPVIVIEGFDPINENSSANLRANYTNSGVEQIFRSNGHDMVYFNFQNGGDDIIQNANVVRDLIEQVNREKVGSEKVIVIGESMGGLIARLAIRSLESSNRAHNISHYISFDAPHKGANLPVGFQSLVRQVDDVTILPNAIKEGLDDALERLDAKAARQLLIRFNGPNPHPDFNTLQTELNRVGFPQKEGIRNIAIVNGAVDGSLGDPGFLSTAGNNIIEAEGLFAGIFSVGAEVVSNNLGGTTRVATLIIRTFGIPTTDKRAFFSFNNLNYDISSGGAVDISQQASDLDTFDLTIDEPLVSFVPLFSSLGSTRSISSQAEMNRSESFLRARSQVPFDQVFGNSRNTEHVSAPAVFLPWLQLLSTELGLNTLGSCNDLPTSNISPPSPRINAPFFFTCKNNGSDIMLRVDNDPDFLGNVYSHTWNVNGPSSFTVNGDAFSVPSTFPVGLYTVTCTRSFSQSTLSGLSPATLLQVRSSSSSRGVSILTTGNSICSGGGGPGPVGPIPLKANLEDFVQVPKGVIVWPNPANNVVNVSYKIQEKSEIKVSLVSINQGFENIVSVGSETRDTGEYTDIFDIGEIAEGIYILIVDINGRQTKSKLIINKQ